MNQFKTIAQDWVNETVATDQLQSKKQLLALRTQMIETLDDIFNHLPPSQEKAEPTKGLDSIASGQVIVEVIDQETQLVFRRALEITYIENDNALKLSGENFQGQPSEIVFLSNKSLDKIHDLTGKGPDEARCQH